MARTPCPVPRVVQFPCALCGALLAALALVKLSGLKEGGGPAVGCALLALAALALLLLWRGGASPDQLVAALLPLGLFLFLRAVSLDHQTQDYQYFLSDWAAFFRENGGWAAIRLPKGNYNVPYLYFLAFLSGLPIPDLYGIKLFSILFDVLLAWGGMRLVRALTGGESRKPYAAFLLLLLLPTVVLNGALWGQCDAIYGALCLHALAAVLEKKPRQSVVLLALAFSFKLQAIFLIPLWGALWFLKRVRFRDLLLFPLTYFLSILPALLLGKPLGDILGVYLGQTVEYSEYLTMNAPSVYALIPYGAQVDTAWAARWGILAAFALVALLGLALWLRRDRVDNCALFTAAVILAVGVPLLLPHMHDRYFFLADVLTLCWACQNPRRAPIAAAVQVASLGGYHAYLVLRYAFPMAWGALLLLAVLAASAVTLWGQLAPAKPKKTAR